MVWELWAPAALAFVGTLGPSLLAAGRIGVRTARAMALGALISILALLLVAFFARAGTIALLDTLLAGVMVALAGLGVRRVFAWALVVVAALAAGKGFGQAAMGFAVPVFLGPALAGAFAWGAAALLALSLAIIRLRARPRSTPGGTTRAGSRRS